MKIGIYINGLGQTFSNESVEKYAERLKNEMSFSNRGIQYAIKNEKYNYYKNKTTNVSSIINLNSNNDVVYKIYEFRYQDILTESFNQKSLIIKNILLFGLVINKFFVLIKRMLVRRNYNRPYQTFWMFLAFFVIASAVLLLIPGSVGFLFESQTKATLFEIKKIFRLANYDIPYLSFHGLKNFAKLATSITTVLIFIVPSAKAFITSLATDFICADDYLIHGKQKQEILGNIELLVDYITEKESEPEIHFHAYSFGSVVALDYLFPYGRSHTYNCKQFVKAFISIGLPFDFINAYYKDNFKDRNLELESSLNWLNVYSITDALASNFRSDDKIGDAMYGVTEHSKPPVNVNYEITIPKKLNAIDFIKLHSMRAHEIYWINKTEGESCLKQILEAMVKKQLIQL